MKKIRIMIVVFIILLLFSGITAFPLRTELHYLMSLKDKFPLFLSEWIVKVNIAISQTPDMVLYGTDWLAFGHIVIALFFIPVYLNPVRHKANIIIAMIACLAIFPIAFICGPIRGIPFFHQLIDCAFGFIGLFPLLYVYKKINQLEKTSYELHA